MPFLFRHLVPIGSAEEIKKHLVSQIGTADTDRNDRIIAFGFLPKSKKSLSFLLRNQHLFLEQVWQMREEDLAPIRSFPALPQF